ncbi:pentapeptide repeat-containing protein [bacterium]|nr:pentapeptide repeat-containing protein [bacterium]
MAEVTVSELRHARLMGSKDFEGFDLSDLNLSGVGWLKGCTLDGADLSGTNLSATDLRSTSFRDAELVGANLSGADLRLADFRGADLTRADLEGANRAGAVFNPTTRSRSRVGERLPTAWAQIVTAPAR